MVFLPSERLLSLYLRGSWNEVICPLEWQLQAEMCSPGQQAAIWVTRCTFSMSGYFHSAAHCCFPLFLVSHYIRVFFFFRDELWACSEYFRCQTSCFSLSNVTLSMTHCISEWHHGIKLRMVKEKWLWEPRDLCLSLYLSASYLEMFSKKSANEYLLCREQACKRWLVD